MVQAVLMTGGRRIAATMEGVSREAVPPNDRQRNLKSRH
jgi:hypothetical protein